jgi:hypothetical protein
LAPLRQPAPADRDLASLDLDVEDGAPLQPCGDRDRPLGERVDSRARRESGLDVFESAHRWIVAATDVVAGLVGRTLAENLGYLHGFAHVPGYAPAVTNPRWDAVLDAAHSHDALSSLMELFSVDYAGMVVKKDEPLEKTPPGFDLFARDDADVFAIYRKTLVRPRAFVTTHWVTLETDEAVITSMFDSSFDHARIRFSAGESAPHPREANGNASAPCSVRIPRPEEMDLRCSLNAEGYAVVVDTWEPGWSATVDDEPAVVERADEVLRAVRVPPGSHRILLTFSAPGFSTGAWISLLTWTIVAIVAFVVERRRAPEAASMERADAPTAQKREAPAKPAHQPARRRTGRKRR